MLETVRLPGREPVLSIGQISDLDFRRVGPLEARTRAMLAGLDVDVLAVTGDVIEFERGGGVAALDGAIGFLESIPARQGRFWVVGESEARNREVLEHALRGRGVRLLWNEEARLSVEGREVSFFGLAKAEARFEPGRWLAEPAIRARSAGLPSPLVDDSGEAPAWRDYEMTGRLEFGDAEDHVGVVAYVSGRQLDRGYLLARWENRPGFYLRRLDRRDMEIVGDTGPARPPGTVVHYRLRVETLESSNRIRARTWPEGSPEPPDWPLEAIDSLPDRPAAGSAGIFVGGGGDQRLFSGWSVTSLTDGRLLGRRDLAGFAATDGSWRFRSVLRDWAGPESADRPYRVLLAHNPDVVLTLEAQGVGPVDLVLSGHTQGGQIRIPWWGAMYTGTELGRHYASGLFRRGGRWLYVNRGIGTSLIPVRLFCPPEVTDLQVPVGSGAPAAVEGS